MHLCAFSQPAGPSWTHSVLTKSRQEGCEGDEERTRRRCHDARHRLRAEHRRDAETNAGEQREADEQGDLSQSHEAQVDLQVGSGYRAEHLSLLVVDVQPPEGELTRIGRRS
jgi:hypothetical protein